MRQVRLDLREAFDVWSDCRRYRYQLGYPTGVDNDRAALLIGTNPSTATWDDPDPTAKRWIGFCLRWGYGWALLGNPRAWSETDTKAVPPDPEAIGPDNAVHLLDLCRRSELVVCGWGTNGGALAIDTMHQLASEGVDLHALKLNQDGSPTHPLYQPWSAKPFSFLKSFWVHNGNNVASCSERDLPTCVPEWADSELTQALALSPGERLPLASGLFVERAKGGLRP